MKVDLKKEIQSKFPIETEPVVLALSGGVDSMVLFDLLKSLDVPLVIAHGNHNVRQASTHEQTYLKKITSDWNVSFETMTITQPIEGNFQAKARDLRYRFFEDVAKKHNISNIVLAHHLDDQIEHFFMHLIHHHNLLTLKGMRFKDKRNGFTILRPLLDVPKQDLLVYAQENQLHYFEDESNRSEQYTRNRIRHQLLPLLEEENPQYRTAIAKHLKSLQDFEHILHDHKNIVLTDDNRKIAQDTFLALPYAMQKYILITELQAVDASFSVSDEMLKEILSQLKTDKNLRIPLSDYLLLRKEYGEIFFDSTHNQPRFHRDIDTECRVRLPNGQTLMFSHEKKYHKTVNCFELWYNDKVFPLEVRHRSEGDYIRFSYGHKKVKDLLIDLKVPPHRRDQLIVVARGSEILWIPELDIRCYQTQKKRVLRIGYTVENNHDLNVR